MSGSRSSYDSNEQYLENLDYLDSLSNDSVSVSSDDEDNLPDIILGSNNVSLNFKI